MRHIYENWLRARLSTGGRSGRLIVGIGLATVTVAVVAVVGLLVFRVVIGAHSVQDYANGLMTLVAAPLVGILVVSRMFMKLAAVRRELRAPDPEAAARRARYRT